MAGNDIPFSTEYCREYDCRNKLRPFRSANRGWSFLLYDDKQEMLWKLPIIAVLIYVGEISAIYIYQNYRKLQKERQKHFVEEQQVKAMKQRLEEAENFYGSIRRVRHEMKTI